MVRKVWKFRNEGVTARAVSMAAEKNGIPQLLATILLNRGIVSEDFKTFLSKSKKGILNPMTMLDMDKAVARIKSAVETGEKIAIYGDYDVDGITSTALLFGFLKTLGADVQYYIPDRKDEGYGINIMAVNKLIKEGVKLLITVDCGITAIGEIEFAKLQGMDVVVTDHHTCKERIPTAAVAVLNPKREDDEYEFDALAGVGVAFKLVLALAMSMGMNTGEVFDKYVELAAIGTIADVVPLTSENRVIVEKGLTLLQNPSRCGIKALLEVSGVSDKKVTTATVAFALAPRINAAGRLSTATTAVELLLTENDVTATEIAKELDASNKERQQTELDIHREAIEMIESDKEFEKKNVIVLAKEGWHNGVIGIVASRLVEHYHRPCILISLDNGVGKGSGRSVGNFNLFNALSACEKLLTNFGGHAVAAGLGINEDKLREFDEKINKYAKENLTAEDLVPVVKIDCVLGGANLNIPTAKLLSSLEPYGMGNETPVFAVKDAEVVSVTAVGMEKKHIRMQVQKDGVRINAIGFGMGEFVDILKYGDIVHLACKLDINNYQGNESAQLVLCDIKMKNTQDI
ncbi:MAG: single-stranded-DNA-specific exonuclease RecJ [Clostridia bacterium]|nr:single-stranded-DNA-specific exonuclease RecJ [Clostridia bacterium]